MSKKQMPLVPEYFGKMPKTVVRLKERWDAHSTPAGMALVAALESREISDGDELVAATKSGIDAARELIANGEDLFVRWCLEVDEDMFKEIFPGTPFSMLDVWRRNSTTDNPEADVGAYWVWQDQLEKLLSEIADGIPASENVDQMEAEMIRILGIKSNDTSAQKGAALALSCIYGNPCTLPDKFDPVRAMHFDFLSTKFVDEAYSCSMESFCDKNGWNDWEALGTLLSDARNETEFLSIVHVLNHIGGSNSDDAQLDFPFIWDEADWDEVGYVMGCISPAERLAMANTILAAPRTRPLERQALQE